MSFLNDLADAVINENKYSLIDVGALFSEEAKARALAQVKQESARKRAREAVRREKQARALDDWERGADTYTNYTYSAPVRLRIKGDNIETSHGARVPIEEAIALLELIHARKDVSGFKIGYYTVESLNSTILKVGCHRIPMTEVLKIEKLLGVITK